MKFLSKVLSSLREDFYELVPKEVRKEALSIVSDARSGVRKSLSESNGAFKEEVLNSPKESSYKEIFQEKFGRS